MTEKNDKKKLSKKEQDLALRVEELTQDLQRTRADFENYRKRVETEKTSAREYGESSVIAKLLPVVDNIERAVGYLPDELKDNSWAKGVNSLTKNLGKSLSDIKVERIDASAGVDFNPELHEAVQFDEEAEGEKEVIAEELQAGYTYKGSVMRHSMVKVTKK